MQSIKEVLDNKSFVSFFKRAILFLVIFISEILFLTLLLDFTGLNFGNAFISTHAHLVTYLFIVLFLIMAHKELLVIKHVGKLERKRLGSFLLLNVVAFFGFYELSKYFVASPSIVSQNPIPYTVAWWALGLAIPFSLLFAFFDFDYVSYFIKKLKKQIFLSAGLSVVFLALLNYSIRLWPLFSEIVAKIVYFMLSLFFEGTVYHMTGTIPTVGIPAITAKIYAPCSGIEGMGLFLLLFTVLALMEYKTINKIKVLLLYPAGLIGAFIVNILRTFFIFVAGHFTSAEFAIGAFHSNVGWILFTLYFLVFIYFAYPWMKK